MKKEGGVEPAGLADPFDFRIDLAPDICAWLRKVEDASRASDPDEHIHVAQALLVLAHESQHFTSGGNEALTECRALQRVRDAAVALGASSDYADEVATTAWEEVYPKEPPEYRSAECRDGGNLDLNPDNPRWP